MLFLGGCSLFGDYEDSRQEELLDTLRRGMERWEEADLQNYQYSYTRSENDEQGNTLSREVAVSVGDGAVQAVTINDREESPSEEDRYFTIEEIFDLLEEAIRADTDRFQMRLHSELGYPGTVLVDTKGNEPGDELLIEMETFEENSSTDGESSSFITASP